ncbi:MAG: hypothetical protein IKU20_07260, partial [Lachnospiraceae bacterium]|nr:hypothetical protein [Lachnospiraceae bacterium]
KQLEDMDLEIQKIREDQKVYREGMMKNVQQVQSYGNELKELQEALKDNPEKALSTFTKNHKDVIKTLDESLGKGLEDISKLGLELSNHNGLIKDTEEEIRQHTDEINTLSIRMNEILTKYESDLKQAGKDLDAQTGFFAWAGRKIGTRKGREERNKKFDEAFDRKWDLDAQQTEMKSLETSMQTVEGRLFEAQQNLDAYKKGWENTKNLLETAIQENYEYTQTLQEKLERQADEFDQANREYEEKVKEIQKDNEIQQELHQDILEHTSVEFDKLNAPLIQKKLLRDQLVQQIQEAKDKIAECDENSKKIEKAKADRAKLVEDKEKFLTDGALSREQMEKELEDAKISASNAKKDLADLHEKYDVRIECHNKLKDFFSQGKVTSNRVLNDLNTAMAKAVDFTGKECQKHTAFLKSRENKLMSDYRKRMTSKETYAERMKPEKGSKKADKAAPINGRIDQYMKHLSSLKKTSNSKEFKNFMGAVMKQYDDVGNFLMGDEIQDATGLGRNRDKVMEDMKKHLTEIVKTADEYMKAKGKASRFTDSGKLRYRFVEEMKADAEEKLGRFAIMEEEKVWIDKLNKMDDSELHVSKDTKFYQTPTYDIVKTAFVKEGELDKADVLDTAGLKRVLPEGLKEVVKEEKPAAGEIKKVETTEIAEEEKTEIKQEEEMENEEEYML